MAESAAKGNHRRRSVEISLNSRRFGANQDVRMAEPGNPRAGYLVSAKIDAHVAEPAPPTSLRPPKRASRRRERLRRLDPTNPTRAAQMVRHFLAKSTIPVHTGSYRFLPFYVLL
jgi:hypothetical protein